MMQHTHACAHTRKSIFVSRFHDICYARYAIFFCIKKLRFMPSPLHIINSENCYSIFSHC